MLDRSRIHDPGSHAECSSPGDVTLSNSWFGILTTAMYDHIEHLDSMGVYKVFGYPTAWIRKCLSFATLSADTCHDNVLLWTHFLHYCPCVPGIQI